MRLGRYCCGLWRMLRMKAGGSAIRASRWTYVPPKRESSSLAVMRSRTGKTAATANRKASGRNGIGRFTPVGVRICRNHITAIPGAPVRRGRSFARIPSGREPLPVSLACSHPARLAHDRCTKQVFMIAGEGGFMPIPPNRGLAGGPGGVFVVKPIPV